MFDFDLDSIPSGPFETPLWWVLIGVIIALLFTLQALETAVDGAWPHQRRDNEYVPGMRGVKPAWAFAAILLVPGALGAGAGAPRSPPGRRRVRGILRRRRRQA